MNIDMAALNMLSSEREIPLDDLVQTLENALLTAYKRTERPPCRSDRARP